MRTRKLFISALVMLAVGAGAALAVPLDLYLVKFAPGTDIYRLAGSQNWPVYHISGQQALTGKQLSNSDNKAVLGSNLVYQGPSENLRWVHLKRNSPMPAIKAVYSGKDILLAEAGNVAAAGVKSGRDHMVKVFNPRPIVMAPPSVIRTSSLARDTTVAMLVNLVDTAEVRTRIEAMQSFDTRFLDAANHDSVVGWIRNQFLDMGIADVRTDTFDIGYGMQQHNIIATIPGLLDTSVVYIVGGHYDSYSPDEYNQAPGADDNASGTVAALEMARVLSLPGNQPNATVRFIAFDAEEYGLYGGEYYAQKALSEGMNIGCMLNYDMIGYKGNDSTFVSKLNPGSESYAYMLGQMAGWYGRLADTNLVPVYNNVYLNGSDSWEFSIRGFPVTYSEEDSFSTVYHQTNDSTTYMSMRYATSIIRAGMGMVGTLANYPQKVNDVVVSDIGSGTKLAVQWTQNTLSNIVGYNVYYGDSTGVYPNSQYTTESADTISGLTPNINYYITVRAVDAYGRESPVASEAIGVPVLLGLDQGILVIDETQNWTTAGFPTDSLQDAFYREILDGYTLTEYEYGSSGEMPELVDLAPYSTVIWHGDDPSSFLASRDSSILRLYMNFGGKVWFVGWKPTGDVRNSAIYPASFAAGNILYDCFKISNVALSGASDSLVAVQGLSGYPAISVDSAKVPIASFIGTMKYIEALSPLAGADTIYVMDMKNDSSAFEGRACAVRDSGKTVFFGFPLYFMDKNQAKAAAQQVMTEFGVFPTGVTGKPDDRRLVTDLRLFQNSPNPFSQQTNISYQLPKAGQVRLNIYNIAGQLVRTLVNGEHLAGKYAVNWNRQDDHNRQVSAGVYIYHLNTDGKTQSRKMIVLK